MVACRRRRRGDCTTEKFPAPRKALEAADAFALASCIRALANDGVEAASSGHSGVSMGMAEAAVGPWGRHMHFDAGAPD